MRVALVLMPSCPLDRETPSLAIAYLASNLLKKGFQVSRFEFNLKLKNIEWIKYIKEINLDEYLIKNSLNFSFNSTEEKYNHLSIYINVSAIEVLKNNPEVVAFSFYKVNKVITLLMAKRIKELNKNVKIILGGPNTFNLDENIKLFLNKKIIDFIIFGEGEILLPNLINNFDTSNFKKIKGIMYSYNGKIVYTGDWVAKKNIDFFEFPCFRKEDLNNSRFNDLIPIITSRGCPYNCNFCTSKDLWKCFRQRSPINIIKEIKYQIKNHGIYKFKFNDSLINSNKKFLKELCNFIIKEKIKLRWRAAARVNKFLNNNILSLMYKSGCRILCFGAESGSDKVLENMNKQITTKLVEDSIKNAYNCGIWVHLFFIVGYPTETKKDFLKTIDFIIKNKDYINSFRVLPFKPIVLKDFTNNKILRNNKDLNNNNNYNLSIEEIHNRLRHIKSIFKYNSFPNYKAFDNNKHIYDDKIKINLKYYNKLKL